MLRTIVLIALAAMLATAEKASFENYKVFRITPETEEQLEVLKQLEDSAEGYSYWQGPTRISRPADLMVAPGLLSDFTELMNDVNVTYETYVPNVQHLIDDENPLTRESGFGWNRYHTLDEIYSWLDSLAAEYPDKVQIVSAGKSYQGRTIKGVRLSFGGEKPGVFIEGGIHAREWISPATVTYLLNEFLTSTDPKIRDLAERYDWYMFPSFNPDGYAYTHKQNRMWRKTLSKSGGSFCRGTDPNRNWGYKWMHGGASNNPCSESYAGTSPFSENETRTMSEYIRSIGSKLFAYIAFHSYSQLLLLPYGHTTAHLDNYNELYAIGTKAMEALSRRYGTKYVTGNIAEAIYVATGASTDWVKATLKLPITYTYELRDTGRHGFILPADQIIPNGQEVLDSFIVMFQEAKRFGYPRSQ